MSIATFCYSPTLFGHPHDSYHHRESTIPFFHQYPSWTRPFETSPQPFYYVYFAYPDAMDAHANEPSTIKIGSGTENGRAQGMNSGNSATRTHRKKGTKTPAVPDRPKYSQPRPLVEVSCGELVLGVKNLRTMIRFSHVFARAFPKPSASADSNGSTPLTDGGDQQIKKLNLDDDRFWDFPSSEAFDAVFAWMDGSMKAKRGETLTLFGFDDPETHDIFEMIDFWAVAQLLDIRPLPRLLRDQIRKRLESITPQLDVIKFAHERLPIHDTIMTKVLHTYFVNGDANKYTEAELKAIFDYGMDEDPQLRERLADMAESRRKRRGWNQARRGGGMSSNVAQSGVRNGNYQHTEEKKSEQPKHETTATPKTTARTEATATTKTTASQGDRSGDASAGDVAQVVSRRKGKAKKGHNPQGKPVPGANFA
jgi:hypothetical protein